MAATHLLACGRERILHLAGPAAAGETSMRLEGVRSAVEAHDKAVLTVVRSEGHLEGGRQAMMQAAPLLSPGCGVVAHNDLTAIGALSVLRDLGLSVPSDVSVVGFDDIALSAYVEPSLTTVKQDKYAMGAWTVDAVSKQLRGLPAEGATWPVELVVRRSTAVWNP